KGTWLVLAVAIYSPYDIASIPLAVKAIEPFRGKVQLGVRPFHDFKEMQTWLPQYKDEGTPVWAIIEDGRVLRWKIGLFFNKEGVPSAERIRNWVEKATR